MYPHIVCYCGREIGSLWYLFVSLREKCIDDALKKAGLAHNISPEVLQLTDVKTDMRGFFEAVSLEECCITRICTARPYHSGR